MFVKKQYQVACEMYPGLREKMHNEVEVEIWKCNAALTDVRSSGNRMALQAKDGGTSRAIREQMMKQEHVINERLAGLAAAHEAIEAMEDGAIVIRGVIEGLCEIVPGVELDVIERQGQIVLENGVVVRVEELAPPIEATPSGLPEQSALVASTGLN